MGWVLVGVGALIALIGYSGGLSINPQSAPQQAVQELRYLHGALGLIVLALGVVVVTRTSRQIAAAASGAAGSSSPVGPRPQPASALLNEGDKVLLHGRGRPGIVRGWAGAFATVEFEDGSIAVHPDFLTRFTGEETESPGAATGLPIVAGDWVENPSRGKGRVKEMRGTEAIVEFGKSEPVQLSIAHLTRTEPPEDFQHDA